MTGHSTTGIKASAPLKTAAGASAPALAPSIAPASVFGVCPPPPAGSYQELTNLYVHGDLFFCGVPWNPSMVPTPAKAYFIQITGTTSYATVKAMLLANSISDDVGNTYVVQNASANPQSMLCLSVSNAVNWPTASDATHVNVGLNQTVVFSCVDATAAGTYAIQSTSKEIGSGTVTSISYTGDGVVYPATPTAAVTTSGTLTPSLLTHSSNTFFAGNVTTGVTAQPTFRQIDYPDLNPSFTANHSLGSSGYQKFPGGLIIQWGTATTPPPFVAALVVFPIPFTTTPAITFTPQSNQGIDVALVQLSKSNTDFMTWAITASTGALLPSVDFDWIAIGF